MPSLNNILISSLLIFMTLSAAEARKKILHNPAPISIAQNVEAEDVKDAITGALIQRGWVNEEQTTQEDNHIIDAALYIRTHKIVTQIKHNSNIVSFEYVSSENMNHKTKKDKQYIHPNYMVWTQQLADQIKTNIEMGDAYDLDIHLNQANNTANPPPTIALNQFQHFKLEPTTLAEPYMGNKGNQRTMTNLSHNLNLQLQPILDQWDNTTDNEQTLLIKPHIMAVRFIGTGVRIFAGSMAGRSWMMVKLSLIDEATGQTIASPELYRLAQLSNGFSVSRRDYKMVEDMAVDIKNYMENNYSKAIGGGRYPPADVKKEIKTQ